MLTKMLKESKGDQVKKCRDGRLPLFIPVRQRLHIVANGALETSLNK